MAQIKSDQSIFDLFIRLTQRELKLFFPDSEQAGFLKIGKREKPTSDGRVHFVAIVPSKEPEAPQKLVVRDIIPHADIEQLDAMEDFLESVLNGKRDDDIDGELNATHAQILEKRLAIIKSRKAELTQKP